MTRNTSGTYDNSRDLIISFFKLHHFSLNMRSLPEIAKFQHTHVGKCTKAYLI